MTQRQNKQKTKTKQIQEDKDKDVTKTIQKLNKTKKNQKGYKNETKRHR